MAKISVNLNETKEKELLAPGVYTFTIRKAALDMTRDQSAKMVVLELVPQESPTDIVFHRYTLKSGILGSMDADKSLKRFLDIFGINYSQGFDTDVLFGQVFRGTVKHEQYNGKTQVRLGDVLGR